MTEFPCFSAPIHLLSCPIIGQLLRNGTTDVNMAYIPPVDLRPTSVNPLTGIYLTSGYQLVPPKSVNPLGDDRLAKTQLDTNVPTPLLWTNCVDRVKQEV